MVNALSHADGWYRDTAQRLLVEQADPRVIPALVGLVTGNGDPLGRQHAMWTLAGMGYNDPAPFLIALNTPNDRVQIAALRVLELIHTETMAQQLAVAMTSLVDEASPAVQLQLALTMGSFASPGTTKALQKLLNAQVHEPVMRDAILSSLDGHEAAFLRALWDDTDWEQPSPNQAIFLETLATALSNRQVPAEMTQLLAHIEEAKAMRSPWAGIMLDALAVHAPKQRETPTVLPVQPSLAMHAQQYDAAWQSSVTRAMQGFTWAGKTKTADAGVETQTMDAETEALYAAGRQHYLAGCAGCHGNDGAGLNRFAPPLANSEWVTGETTPLIRLVLHGIEGPITVNGKVYDAPEILPVMPGHSVLDDKELASILTYIRLAWGNDATPIDARTVSRVRHRSQGRVIPWTVDALLEAPEVLD